MTNEEKFKTTKVEAAWKRESATTENSSAVGNGAKMLSALKAIVDVFDSKEPMSQQERELVVYNLAKNALAEPPRNCDVYADEAEARAAFLSEKCLHPCGNCTVRKDKSALCHPCGIEWLFATAKKGENYGSK